MTDRSNVRILSFPVDDDALRAEVERALAVLPATGATAAQLETALRPWYRSVQVRARNPLGGYADEPSEVWYVYRDGRIRRRNESLDRVYAVLATARSTRRSSEELLAAARRTASLARRVVTRTGPGEPSEDAAALEEPTTPT